ncbi:hypothetical protein LTSEWAN_2867 [Salmonella enterica subsp. enterica serovar Wandsworth str. A4-580]|uniref:Uncharacterized protein n=1 Tax=Salmonella enterica subsp. enterica serovar Wandsworth str. A4-580 TaxID=913086 RepID=G5SCB2_SALET|nr:hypothetical protein LTSEWAN_2867 [Salmonella enterica subsp. enterica serovar Wandsworth str. A4-580]
MKGKGTLPASIADAHHILPASIADALRIVQKYKKRRKPRCPNS